jgi:hypothetical protein
MRSSLARIAAALACTTATACGGDGSTEDATFEAVVKDVLVPRCTFASCHAPPTVAAGLDLTAERACGMLIDQASCLFPDRMRVVPGKPDDSFLFHKIVGQGLSQTPTGTCAPTNLLMPFGGSQIPQGELDLVRSWIAAGAECMSTPVDPGDLAPAIATIAADRLAPVAGETVTITVTLDKAATEAGQVVMLAMDTNAISAPVQVVIPAAATVARFEAYALRPASRFVLRATTGKSSKQLVLRIAGLDIAEVLTDPVGIDNGRQWIKLHNRSLLPIDLSGYSLRAGDHSYGMTTVLLTGMLLPGGCAVVGGPEHSAINGDPVYTQTIDFAPDLPHPRTATSGFAVFDSNPTPADGIATPVDTMIVGANNSARLLGPNGNIPDVYCGTPVPGMSARRTGLTSCAESMMQPNSCP